MALKRGNSPSNRPLREGVISFYSGARLHPFSVCSVKVLIPEEELEREGLASSTLTGMSRPALQMIVWGLPEASCKPSKGASAKSPKTGKRRG